MKSGPEELLATLARLEETIPGQHLRTALRDGAKVVQAQMIADAPDKSGTTKGAIKVRAMKRSRTRVGMMVSIGEGWFRGDTFYAGFVNYGHRLGKRLSRGQVAAAGDTRKEVAGTHWMNRAWEASIGRAAEVVFAKLKSLAEQEAAK